MSQNFCDAKCLAHHFCWHKVFAFALQVTISCAHGKTLCRVSTVRTVAQSHLGRTSKLVLDSRFAAPHDPQMSYKGSHSARKVMLDLLRSVEVQDLLENHIDCPKEVPNITLAFMRNCCGCDCFLPHPQINLQQKERDKVFSFFLNMVWG